MELRPDETSRACHAHREELLHVDIELLLCESTALQQNERSERYHRDLGIMRYIYHK